MYIKDQGGLSMFIKSNILRSPHAFATRRGGISEQDHTKSLNLAFGRGDDDGIVLKNLEIFANSVGFDAKNVVSMPQIHSDNIFKVGRLDCGKGYFVREDLSSGDGYITDEKGVVLGIKTADCVPILFEAEKDGKIVAVGAVHAGWRGTVAGIAPKCVKMLCDNYDVDPEHIKAAIGPCIHKCCYEVGEDLRKEVKNGLGHSFAERFVVPQVGMKNKYNCDLVGINRELILSSGVRSENIDALDLCTCCHPDLFFSHRFSSGVRGTMLNVIFVQN